MHIKLVIKSLVTKHLQLEWGASFSLSCFISPANSVSESLEESAAAYTKATAKKCILEKVDVKTGEESESNVLQVGKIFSLFSCK